MISSTFFVIVLAMKPDIKSLANLAKVYVDEKELADFEKDISSILGFVSQVQSLDLDMEPRLGKLYNVLYEDDESFDYDYDKEALIKSAKKNDGKYILIKKVIKN